MPEWPDVHGQTAELVSGTFGDQGRHWLRDLPDLVRTLAERWRLNPAGEAFPGARASFVAPVNDQRGRALVLKIAPGVPWVRQEYHALAYWDGNAAVRVVDADLSLGALLLERLDPGCSLAASRDPEGDGTQVLVSVVSRFERRRAVPAELPRVETWLKKLDGTPADSAVPGLELERSVARRVRDDLLGRAGRSGVLHADLHHGNLLRHGVDWTAIDPKGLIGPPEAEAAAFLRNPRRDIVGRPDGVTWTIERARSIADGLAWELELVLGWAYVLGVLAAEWSLEDGEDLDDARRWLRCALVLKAAYQAEVA